MTTLPLIALLSSLASAPAPSEAPTASPPAKDVPPAAEMAKPISVHLQCYADTKCKSPINSCSRPFARSMRVIFAGKPGRCTPLALVPEGLFGDLTQDHKLPR